MKLVPDNVEESGLLNVLSYVLKYRKKAFFRFSKFLQLYLMASLVVLSAQILLSKPNDALSFVLTFVLPAIIGYGILFVVYVILYVDVIKAEKEKRKRELGKTLSINRSI